MHSLKTTKGHLLHKHYLWTEGTVGDYKAPHVECRHAHLQGFNTRLKCAKRELWIRFMKCLRNPEQVFQLPRISPKRSATKSPRFSLEISCQPPRNTSKRSSAACLAELWTSERCEGWGCICCCPPCDTPIWEYMLCCMYVYTYIHVYITCMYMLYMLCK